MDSFGRLTSLRLAEVSLVNLKFIEDSQPRIEDLSLYRCCSTPEAFATLVNKFPNLTRLTLVEVLHRPKKAPPPQLSILSPQSSLKLFIANVSRDDCFLDLIFSVLWDEVSILKGSYSTRLRPQYFIDRASTNLKRLDVQDYISRRTYHDLPAIVPWKY